MSPEFDEARVLEAALDIFGDDATTEGRTNVLLAMTEAESMPPSTADPFSRAAAESMKDSAAVLKERVFEVIAENEAAGHPVATFEIEALLGLSHQTASPRVWELRKEGRIRRIAKKRAPSGREAAVLGVGPEDDELVNGSSEEFDELRHDLWAIVQRQDVLTERTLIGLAERRGHAVPDPLDPLFDWAVRAMWIEKTDEINNGLPVWRSKQKGVQVHGAAA